MSELFEVCFEEINLNQAIDALQLLSYFADKLEPKFDYKSVLNEISSSEEAYCLSFGAQKLRLTEEVFIYSVQIRLLKYENVFSLEFNFIGGNSFTDLNVPVKELCIFSTNIAKKFHIENYYAGLEPASDEDTRIFTGSNLGPFLV